MSGTSDALVLKEEDVQMMLSAQVHTGAPNVDHRMERYVYRRRADGTHIINVKQTWEKLLLAARAIVAVENPKDVVIISARTYGQRSVMKFASYTGAQAIAGRFTPGAFTNHVIQDKFREPRLLIVIDPAMDHQPISEAAFVNLPVIALCNTDSLTQFVDIAIPCNNKSIKSIGLIVWMLAREVLRMRGTVSRQLKWEVMVDLFFYREPEEVDKETKAIETAAASDPWAASATTGTGAGPVDSAPAIPTFGSAPAPVPAAGALPGVAPASDNWADASWDPTSAPTAGIAEGW